MQVNSVKSTSINNSRPCFKGAKEEQIFEKIVNYGLKKAQQTAIEENAIEPILAHFKNAFNSLKEHFTKEKYDITELSPDKFKLESNGEDIRIVRFPDNHIQYVEKRPLFKDIFSGKHIAYIVNKDKKKKPILGKMLDAFVIKIDEKALNKGKTKVARISFTDVITPEHEAFKYQDISDLRMEIDKNAIVSLES